ncbi:hypothetical protein [Streptacidiphilus sp. PAMC 29251]
MSNPTEPDAQHAAIVTAIRAFAFWNYGLDDTDPNSEYAEWVPDLATALQAVLLPRRGDSVEAWLKAQRDEYMQGGITANAIDNLLDDYRLHADMGTPLGEHVCEQHCDCGGGGE